MRSILSYVRQNKIRLNANNEIKTHPTPYYLSQRKATCDRHTQKPTLVLRLFFQSHQWIKSVPTIAGRL